MRASSRWPDGTETTGAGDRVTGRPPASAGAMVVAGGIMGFDVVFSLNVTTLTDVIALLNLLFECQKLCELLRLSGLPPRHKRGGTHDKG